MVQGLAPLKAVHVEGRTGRKISVIRGANGQLHAIDFHCFHNGGPLGEGSIEDIEDIGTVVRCPWHHYVIDVSTGERLIRRDTDGSSGVPCWQREPKKQRTHSVYTDAHGEVCITISERDTARPVESLESDAYNLPLDPALRPHGAGSASIAFTCRKSRATEAVLRATGLNAATPTVTTKRSIDAARTTASATVETIAAPLHSPSTLKQTTLDSLFSPIAKRETAGPLEHEAMDTSS